jgi:hypothetical protein
MHTIEKSSSGVKTMAGRKNTALDVLLSAPASRINLNKNAMLKCGLVSSGSGKKSPKKKKGINRQSANPL